MNAIRTCSEFNVLCASVMLALQPLAAELTELPRDIVATNRYVNCISFNRTVEIVGTNDVRMSLVAKLRKGLTIPSKEELLQGGPITLNDAAGYLYEHVNMIRPPAACVEYKEIFFFSGGRSGKHVADFTSGYAILKGFKHVVPWDEKDVATLTDP